MIVPRGSVWCHSGVCQRWSGTRDLLRYEVSRQVGFSIESCPQHHGGMGCIVQGADYDVFCRGTTLETHITAVAAKVTNLSPLGNTFVILM